MSCTVGAATANDVWDVNRSVPEILGDLFWYIYGANDTLCIGHQDSSLEYSFAFRPYALWTGQDAKQVDLPETCGSWVNDSTWSTGEHNSC